LPGELTDHQREIPEFGHGGVRGCLLTGSCGEVMLVCLDQAVSGLVRDGSRKPLVQARY
jgi:hypothetical protein